MFFKRTTTLFDTQLEQLSHKAVAAAETVDAMVRDPSTAAAQARLVGDLEHGADRIVRETVALQAKTLGSVERSDLLQLLERVDDVVDASDAVAQRLWLHQVGPATDEARAMAALFAETARTVRDLIATLRTMQGPHEVLELCVELARLENDGDELYRNAMLALFSGRYDAMHVARWKDVYERLESGVNKCADVARLVEGLVQAIA